MSERTPHHDPPPILGRWRYLYALVLGNLALDMLLLWIFTRAFA
jgi:hypothetical protein